MPPKEQQNQPAATSSSSKDQEGSPDEKMAEIMAKLKARQEADRKRLIEEIDSEEDLGDDGSSESANSSDKDYDLALKQFGDGTVDPKREAQKAKAAAGIKDDDDDEDSPYLIGKEGTKIKRPLGTKKEVMELAQYSRTEADLSFAENLEADPVDGLKPITWNQVKKFIGYEREAKGFKVNGVIATRDQANWDKIKHIEVRDEEGTEKSLFFYDSEATTFKWEDVNVGNKISIKEPRFHRFMDGSEGMRVETCASILSVIPQKFSDKDRLSFGRRHKDNGNQKYQERRYDDAIDEYDHAIRHLRGTFHEAPENEAAAKELAQSCFLNIAACFIAEAKFSQVETPCTKALTFNANKTLNSKAYFRMAQAEEALGNYSNARSNLERANELLPNDPKITALLQKINGISRELSTAQRQLYSKKEESLASKINKNKNNNKKKTNNSNNTTASTSTSQQQSSTTTTTVTSKRSSTNSRRDVTPTPAQRTNSSFGSNASSIQKTASTSSSYGSLIPRVANYRFGFQTGVLDVLSGASSKIEMESIDNFRDLGNLKTVRTVLSSNATSGQTSPIQGPASNHGSSDTRSNASGNSSSSSPAGRSRSANASSKYTTIQSTTRKHLLYRSATLIGLTINDMDTLKNRLRIKTIIDLRNANEIRRRIVERQEFIENENKKRARVRLDMKKAEVATRRQLTQQEKLEKVKRDKYGAHDDEDYNEEQEGMRRRALGEKKVADKKPKFSVDPDIIERDSEDEREEFEAITEYEAGLQRDPELKNLQFVDYEAHFRPVTVKCDPGVVSRYSAKDYDEFAKTNPGLVTTGKVTRQEWIRQMPVTVHIDFSSRTVFSLAAWWVWIVVMFLAVCLQINLAAKVIVKMTAARVGAIAYYRALLVHQKIEVKEIFEILGDISNYPVLICCQVGKDRTGVMIALILLAVGVSKEDVIRDYTKTKSTKATEEWLEKVGLHQDEWTQAKPETIKGLIAAIEEEGGIERYLKTAVGISEETLENVRTNLNSD